jgi:hypothetical protein
MAESKSNCANCSLRQRAEAKPNTLMAKLWRWHTGWCPGWKAYQKELAQTQQPAMSPKQ